VAPILFANVKDGGLRLCIDYWALNAVTVKNRYPLPQISAMLAHVQDARIFTKLNLHSACNLIRMREGDEYNMAFWTRYGQFEYPVMRFGLTNAPARFQSYIDDCVRSYVDDFTVWYLQDILIFSEN
jgi:hypothetical protein